MDAFRSTLQRLKTHGQSTMKLPPGEDSETTVILPRLIKHDLMETTSFENPTKTSDFRPSQGANLPRPSYPIDLLKGSQQK
jgi:hypothetical protein